MIRKISSLLFFIWPLFGVAQQYYGPIDPIESGFGSYGTHPVLIDSFPNSSSNQMVTIFHPGDISAPVPTILYCHGFGITDYNSHLGLLNFIASKGYAVVYSPYPSSIFHNSNNNKMLDGFIEAASVYSDIIDTTRIGILGHSYGAGAIPWVGKKLFTESGWGENGKFMFLNASWFIRNMDQEDLESFPDDCKLICQVNDQDRSNDHRMSIDLFCNINIPVEEKDFVLVKADTIAIDQDSSYIYHAAHNLIGTVGHSSETRFDAQDYYAVFRLLDALAVYTFTGDLNAKHVALGSGHPDQVYMGGQLSPLLVTDSPEPAHPESFYNAWPCHTNFFGINPRIEHCDDMCPVSSTIAVTNQPDYITVYPNPVSGRELIIEWDETQQITAFKLYSMNGEMISSGRLEPDQLKYQLDMPDCPKGVYILTLIGSEIKTFKIIRN